MFLGLDLGTSGLKGILLDERERVIGHASATLSVQRPRPGWAEQDPASWIEAAQAVFADLRESAPKALSQVQAIGLSGQMHGATLLNHQGKVLRPCLLWNDTRAQAQADRLTNQSLFPSRSGNQVFAGFTAPKVQWVQENEPDIFAHTAKILLPKDYLRFWLTGEFVSDPSDASGTAWLNPQNRQWDSDLLAATNLGPDHMPALVEGTAVSGQVRADLAAKLGLSSDRPIYVAGGGGDNAATAAGLGLTGDGIFASKASEEKIFGSEDLRGKALKEQTFRGETSGFLSLGTSGVVMVPSLRHVPDPDRAVHAFCHALPARWLRMGVMLACTDALNWYARTMGCSIQSLTAALPSALLPPSSAQFFPYLGGERTPHANANLRGGWYGLGFEHDQQGMTHAVLQGVSFALKDNLAALAANPAHLIVAGGGSGSSYWLKMLATILNIPLHISESAANAAAVGAARLGRACLVPTCSFVPPDITTFVEPDAALVDAYGQAYATFQQSAKLLPS